MFKAMTRLADLKVKIFADGADRAGMLELYRNSLVKGFTTNPTLMRSAGIIDYEAFAHDILTAIPDRPISLEVFSDNFAEMESQACRIASWAQCLCQDSRDQYRIGISDSVDSQSGQGRRQAKRDSDYDLGAGEGCGGSPGGGTGCMYLGVRGTRPADTGRDPVPMMAAAVEMLRIHPNIELIWASPREILNVLHADSVGCHIITVTHNLLKKLSFFGKDLDEFSLDTVKMFRNDAAQSGFPALMNTIGN